MKLLRIFAALLLVSSLSVFAGCPDNGGTTGGSAWTDDQHVTLYAAELCSDTDAGKKCLQDAGLFDDKGVRIKDKWTVFSEDHEKWAMTGDNAKKVADLTPKTAEAYLKAHPFKR